MILSSDEGPTLETLDWAFPIGSTPNYLYFDLILKGSFKPIKILHLKLIYTNNILLSVSTNISRTNRRRDILIGPNYQLARSSFNWSFSMQVLYNIIKSTYKKLGSYDSPFPSWLNMHFQLWRHKQIDSMTIHLFPSPMSIYIYWIKALCQSKQGFDRYIQSTFTFNQPYIGKSLFFIAVVVIVS